MNKRSSSRLKKKDELLFLNFLSFEDHIKRNNIDSSISENQDEISGSNLTRIPSLFEPVPNEKFQKFRSDKREDQHLEVTTPPLWRYEEIDVPWKEEQLDLLILDNATSVRSTWLSWLTGLTHTDSTWTVQYVSLIKYLRFTSRLFKISLVSNSCLLLNLERISPWSTFILRRTTFLLM